MPDLQKLSYRLYITTLILLLSACGGGGSSGGDAPADPPATNPPVSNPPPNVNPTAAFTITPDNGNAPLTITTDAAASSDSDGTISTYSWDFAGTAAIGSLAQHTFTDEGVYTVTLTVTDDDGGSASASQTVTVDPPVATVTISGRVDVLSSSAVDSDVNDVLTFVTNNNNFDEAQPLPTPVTLGGYANIAGAGADGHLQAGGDPADFYQVSLTGDEAIVLTIAEATADLDLRLWDAGRTLVDASTGVTATESLTVPAPGVYFVEVLPFAGASNYVLNIGQDTSSQQQRAPVRLTDPIVPNQLIVKRKAASSGTGKTLDISQLNSLQSGALQSGALQSRHYKLQTRHPGAAATGADGQAQPGLYQLTDITAQALKLPEGGKASALLAARWHTLMACKEMSHDDGIAYAEPNLLVQAHATPNDEFYGSQWHYPNISLPTAWDTTTGDASVIVAVVDTGVLLNHPDLNDNLISGFDFISDAARSGDGDGIDADPSDPGDGEFGGSSSFHGTHVAGTVGAESNNNIGVAGVAWQTSIMPLRVLGEGGGSTFDIVQAVRYAAGLNNNSGTVPAQPADIINLSLGGPFSSQAEQDAYTQAIQAGVLIIASAGNDSSSLPSYPAAYDGVISVSATTISNTLAGYSNFGSTIDIAAPGGSNITDLNGDGIGDGVISTIGDDSSGPIELGYATLSGTSMAAPHVAGVAALMKAIHGAMTPEEFRLALLAGDLTDDLGASGRDDNFGHGLINAQKAVATAQLLANGQGSDPGPIITASASTLNFGTLLTQLAVTIQNIGTGTPSITTVTPSETWASVTPPAAADGLGVYQVNIDRTGLSDGIYQATLEFVTDANNVIVNLIMQVSSVNLSANAGVHYVILVDGDNQVIPQTAVVAAMDGAYPFTINNVPPGQYRLFAGSDADNDSILCDAGEACGAYPALDSPEFIVVNENQDSLNFESSFRVALGTANNNMSADEPQAALTELPFNKPAQATNEQVSDE